MKTGAITVRTLGSVVKMVRSAKAAGEKIVTTNGCFDILHVGHVRYLQGARKLGSMLVVGINSDASVRRLKGPGRPIVPARERAEIVSALRAVDAVFIFNDATPIRWLKQLKPHIHVKGADRTVDQVVEKKVVEASGGRLVLVPYIKNKSTTNIIKRIRKN
ncbi:MAG: D-glycero-beta-D-manno-heptose 1-phosphate adenylyltransferase [bacterium]|nr:D-glycero-beta-D-manno-heptose 1-phosphate adenylyltransferase [bacterium]